MKINSIFTEQGFIHNYTFIDDNLTTQSIYSDENNLFCVFQFSVDGSDELDGDPRDLLVIDYRFILDLKKIKDDFNKSSLIRKLLPGDQFSDYMLDLLQQQFFRLDKMGLWKNFDPHMSTYNSVMNLNNNNISFYSPGEAYVGHLRFRCEKKVGEKIIFNDYEIITTLTNLLFAIKNSPDFKLPLTQIDSLTKSFARDSLNSEYLADISCMHLRNTDEFNQTLKNILSQ